jgi:hypothetical protein
MSDYLSHHRTIKQRPPIILSTFGVGSLGTTDELAIRGSARWVLDAVVEVF